MVLEHEHACLDNLCPVPNEILFSVPAADPGCATLAAGRACHVIWSSYRNLADIAPDEPPATDYLREMRNCDCARPLIDYGEEWP